VSTNIWTPIRAELRRILLGVTGVPDIAYELAPVKYVPTIGLPYIRERIEKGNSRTATLGTYGKIEEQGIYLIDLYWPDRLQVDGEKLSDAIRCAYWHGREISSAEADPINGQVTSCDARSAIPAEAWVIFPIRVNFFVRRDTAQGRAA
jgi:hypothetical protein